MGYARSAIFAVVLVILPAVLSAQTIPSPFEFIETRHEVGLYGGYLATDPGELGLAPKSAPIAGARYDILFTGPLSGEVGLAFSPTKRDVKTRIGASTSLSDVEEVDAHLLIADAGLRFHFTGPRRWNGLAPYALVTGGFVFDLAGTGAIEAQIEEEDRFSFGPAFAASLGLGSQYFLTDNVSLRVEARDHVWRLSYPDLFTGLEGAENEWANNFSLTVGGAIHF